MVVSVPQLWQFSRLYPRTFWRILVSWLFYSCPENIQKSNVSRFNYSYCWDELFHQAKKRLFLTTKMKLVEFKSWGLLTLISIRFHFDYEHRKYNFMCVMSSNTSNNSSTGRHSQLLPHEQSAFILYHIIRL